MKKKVSSTPRTQLKEKKKPRLLSKWCEIKHNHILQMTPEVRENRTCHKAALRSFYVSIIQPLLAIQSGHVRSIHTVIVRNNHTSSHLHLLQAEQKGKTKPHSTDKAATSTDVSSDLKSHISSPRNLCCTRSMWTCIKFSSNWIH